MEYDKVTSTAFGKPQKKKFLVAGTLKNYFLSAFLPYFLPDVPAADIQIRDFLFPLDIRGNTGNGKLPRESEGCYYMETQGTCNARLARLWYTGRLQDDRNTFITKISLLTIFVHNIVRYIS